MGFGDVTLMAVVGAAVGPTRALVVIFAGAFIGAVSFLLIVYPVARLRSARAHAAGAGVALATDAPGDADGRASVDTTMPQVPFGVFLAPAALLTLLWGQSLIERYLAYVSSF
jgi:leader peptidase (prepilin peptidase)/N-methyltransferase